MKLFTVIPISKTAGELAPRYDLLPMNHAAACNFMDACRNSSTDYKLHEWPADVPAPPGPPCFAMGYKRDKSTIPFADAVECYDTLGVALAEASKRLQGYPRGKMGLTTDEAKASAQWKADRTAFDRAAKAIRDFGGKFLRAYRGEWKAEVQRRREARQPVS
jgi:hypothetical protein